MDSLGDIAEGASRPDGGQPRLQAGDLILMHAT